MRRELPHDWRYYLSAVLGVVVMLALSPLLIPLIILYLVHDWIRGSFLRWRFKRVWGARGKVGVLVYSDSPNWKEYVESSLLPRIADRLVSVNWSSRSQWRGNRPVEVRVFEHWAGEREFNPMAIIVPRKGKVRTVRFWQAFRDFKHGRTDELRKQEALLLEAIDAA